MSIEQAIRRRGRPARPVADRFREKIAKTDLCWFWTGPQTARGYGYLIVTNGRASSKMLYAHRISHEMYLGPIPDGLVIDHLCRNIRCVNPDHLEAVTQGENVRRGEANRPQSHCNRGHEMAGDNLYVDPSGARHCRECSRRRGREHMRRKRAAT